MIEINKEGGPEGPLRASIVVSSSTEPEAEGSIGRGADAFLRFGLKPNLRRRFSPEGQEDIEGGLGIILETIRIIGAQGRSPDELARIFRSRTQDLKLRMERLLPSVVVVQPMGSNPNPTSQTNP